MKRCDEKIFYFFAVGKEEEGECFALISKEREVRAGSARRLRGWELFGSSLRLGFAYASII